MSRTNGKITKVTKSKQDSKSKNNIPKVSRKKTKLLSEEAINIADRRREMKTKAASRGHEAAKRRLPTTSSEKQINISKRHAEKIESDNGAGITRYLL